MIQTYIGDWVDCDYETWNELIEDGWVFGYPDFKGGFVVMVKNGYINQFRDKPEVKKKDL